MASPEPVSTKRCPACQQWSAWQQQATDRCQHCGQPLDPRAYQQAEQQATAQPPKSTIRLVEIRPDDGAFVRFFKTLVRGGQLLFMAVVGVIIWLVTAIAA